VQINADLSDGNPSSHNLSTLRISNQLPKSSSENDNAAPLHRVERCGFRRQNATQCASPAWERVASPDLLRGLPVCDEHRDQLSIALGLTVEAL